MGRATADEQRFLVDLITGNLRQGALDGVVLAAVAKAYAVPEPVVRRAAMLAGTAAEVAGLAARGGVEALEQVGLVVGRPVRPMLAASAKTAAEAVGCGRRWRPPRRRQARRHPGAGAPALGRGHASTPAASTRSPSGCPRSSRPWPRCPVATSCSTARRSSCSTTGGRRRSRSPGRAPPAPPTSRGCASGCRSRRSCSTSCTATGSTSSTSRALARHESLVDLAPHLLVPRLLTVDAGEAERFFAELVAAGPRGRRRQGRRQPVRRRAPGQRLGQGQADAHPRPRRARGRVGVRAGGRAPCRTSTSAPATPTPAASS